MGRDRSRSPRRHEHRHSHVNRHGNRDREGDRHCNNDRKRRSPDVPEDSEAEKKRQRLAKLAAWKQKTGGDGEAPAPLGTGPQPSRQQAAAWMPWEDQSTPAYRAPAAPVVPMLPPEIAALKAKAAIAEMEQAAAAARAQATNEVDPLDAFMAQEVAPEVAAAEAAEARAKEQRRLEQARQIAEGKPIPKLEQILDEEEEEVPDVEIQIPANKVKLMIGAGGEKIKHIQRKSKARVQLKKEDADLEVAFGAGPKLEPPPGSAKDADGKPKLVTVMLFGNTDECAKAQRLIEEAVENKEAKQKQRQKEYEKKREAKWRDRQMYHLRHARDYEALELPMGASKADIKRAYREMAKKWHPDKHGGSEDAKVRFQGISAAFESLMTTDEDAKIEALAYAANLAKTAQT